jgi:hypothetical protein
MNAYLIAGLLGTLLLVGGPTYFIMTGSGGSDLNVLGEKGNVLFLKDTNTVTVSSNLDFNVDNNGLTVGKFLVFERDGNVVISDGS